MLFLKRLFISFLVFAALPGCAASAQTTTAAASHADDEDLRQTVRELALRVSALEEELHRQQARSAIESASLKPAVLVEPTVDVRSSVESISSSSVAETAPVASVRAQSATTPQNAPSTA